MMPTGSAIITRLPKIVRMPTMRPSAVIGTASP